MKENFNYLTKNSFDILQTKHASSMLASKILV